eukprot:2192970-Amphidinium_carterae.2
MGCPGDAGSISATPWAPSQCGLKPEPVEWAGQHLVEQTHRSSCKLCSALSPCRSKGYCPVRTARSFLNALKKDTLY